MDGPLRFACLLFLLVKAGCSGQNTNFMFMQSHCFVFAQTCKDVVHINMVMKQEMYIYFRSRIYFHHFIRFASPFYRITKDMRTDLKIRTIHDSIYGGLMWQLRSGGFLEV